MAVILLPILLLGYSYAAPAVNVGTTKTVAAIETKEANLDTDLKTDASTYYDRYSDYGSRGYPSSGYGGGVTGYGLLDDRYSNTGAYDTNGYGGYAGTGGYGNSGYDGYRSGYGSAGYGNSGYGNTGYGSGSGGYGSGSGGYGIGGGGYGSGSYGSGGYGTSYGNGGYGASYGNGGYGGYTGNGGLNSYYGYNNPSYQGYGHLGYGYYNKRPSYGNIYNNGITPSLVTGYRGYSRK